MRDGSAIPKEEVLKIHPFWKKHPKVGFVILIIAISIFIIPSLVKPRMSESISEKGKYEIVYQKRFGLSEIIMCYINSDDDGELKNIGAKLAGENKLAWVFFYNDKSKMKNIMNSKDALDAIPADGFYAKYSVEYGLKRNENTYIAKQTNGPLKIEILEERTRNNLRWYTYYVENYTDSRSTDNAMIEIAQKLPYDKSGFTEAFFFNDRNNAPKLAKNGGWSGNESQNTWNEKYGKYCVGYYSVGGEYSGEFSKGWK